MLVINGTKGKKNAVLFDTLLERSVLFPGKREYYVNFFLSTINFAMNFCYCERVEPRSHFKSRLSLIVQVNHNRLNSYFRSHCQPLQPFENCQRVSATIRR